MSFFSRRTPRESEDEAKINSNQSEQPKPDDANQEVIAEDDSIEAEIETIDVPDHIFDTALGAGSNLEGTLISDGNVRLDGKFKGTLKIHENILVGITAEIEADIAAKNVSIAGIVRGNVSGKKVHLLSTARIWGNIIAKTFITEDGAFIEGRISMSEDAHKEPDSDNTGEAKP